MRKKEVEMKVGLRRSEEAGREKNFPPGYLICLPLRAEAHKLSYSISI